MEAGDLLAVRKLALIREVQTTPEGDDIGYAKCIAFSFFLKRRPRT